MDITKLHKTYQGIDDSNICLEDKNFEYEIDWGSGQLSITIRDKRKHLYVFDKTFDVVAKEFI